MRKSGFSWLARLFFLTAILLLSCSSKGAASECDIALIESYSPSKDPFLQKAYIELQGLYNYPNLVELDDTDTILDLADKIDAGCQKGCIRKITIVGYGSSGSIRVGSALYIDINNTSVVSSIFDMCDSSSEILLIGSNVGACNKGSSMLYDLAKAANATVKASVDMVMYDPPAGSNLPDGVNQYIDTGRFQTATPTSKPNHMEAKKDQKAKKKTAKATIDYYCPCNEFAYEGIQECTNGCSTSLSCYANICDAYSKNNTWDTYNSNPVLAAGTAGSWDESGVSSPAVIKESPYAMWYTGWDSSSYESIGYATSHNGLDLTKHPNNPVLSSGAPGSWDDNGVYNPHVIKGEGTYKMWYTGYSSTDTVFQIGYATSSDGIIWTKDSNNPVLSAGTSGTWDADGVGAATVIKDGTTYKMWYEGSDVQRWLRIGYATSPDGINWTKDPNNPVISEGDWESFNEWGVAAPSVVKDGATYHMLFIGIDANNLYSIGHAYSPDGSNWTESPDNPHFSRGYGDVWDSGDVGHPTLFKDDNESVFKVFYRGQDESTWSIGYGVAASLEGAVSTSTTTAINPTTSTTTITTETTTTSTTIEDQPCPAELIYGENSEEIKLLRIYRDEILSQNPEGQEIIRLYYEWSPALVRTMEEDEAFKEDVKDMIDGVLELIGEEAE